MARRFLTPIDIPPVDLLYAATIATDASKGTHFRARSGEPEPHGVSTDLP